MFSNEQMKAWYTNANNQHTKQTNKQKKDTHLNSERQQ